MKKVSKKLVTTIVATALFFSMFSVASAQSVDPFHAVVEEQNKKYNVALEYIPVSANADLNVYKDFVEETAQNTRATLDFIQSIEYRKVTEKVSKASVNSVIIVKEKTKTVSAATTSSNLPVSKYLGTATYNIVQGNIITSLTSFSAKYDNDILPSLFGRIYFYDVTSYRDNYYDGGHTLAVTSIGKLSCVDPDYENYQLGNVTNLFMYSDTY